MGTFLQKKKSNVNTVMRWVSQGGGEEKADKGHFGVMLRPVARE